MTNHFKDEVRVGTRNCGFCSTNSHELCKGAIRNGDLSVYQCPCACVEQKPERCTECFSTEASDLGRPWLCDDRDACDARVRHRLSGYTVYRQITEIQERSSEMPRSSKGKKACVCCGEPTRGGQFLPGHDSKWLAGWVVKVKSGETSVELASAEITKVSAHLASKFTKRVQ